MNAEKSLKLARRFIELPVEKRRAFLDGLRAEKIDFSVFPIPAGVDAEDRQALSYAQQRMWFLWQLDPQSGAYNLPGAVCLNGVLNVPALEQAFASLVARHETLRTVFKRHADDRLEQVPLTQPLNVEQQDLSALPDAEREQAVIAQAQQQSLLPFDLGSGPLLRVKLLKLAPDEHVLLLTLHHIVSDGWSMNVLIDEFTRCYDAHARGDQPQLPALPIQYSDYALWQRRWLEAGEQARQLQYWQGKLGDVHDVIELPTDHVRPPMPSYRGTRHEFSIDPQLAEQLRALARTNQVTLFMLLLGAFNILLHRYTGQDDLRVGVPIANRNRSEIEGLIGFFVNTQVLRTQLNGQTRVSELLRDIKETALGAQAHQDLPFEQLVEALKLERSISHNPLFQVMYNHQPQVADVTTLKTASGLTLGAVDWQSRTTQFDLTLDTWEKGGRLLAAFTYANDLFEAPTIARMARHFTALLHALVKDDDQRIGELPMLDAAEQQVLVHDWNATAERYPTGVCIHELIHAQALRTPDATALVFGSQQLSYAQLDARANQLAHLLRDQGVGPDVLVGISVHRSLEMVIGLLAILKAGGAYVPLDPEYPRERLAYMIEDSGIGLLLTQSALLPTLPVDDVTTLVLDQQADWLDGYSERCPLQTSDSRNLAYVIYTSGSTGRPKGAGNSHAALVNRLCWMQQAYAIDGSDAVLQKTPFSFDVSVWEFFWPLMTGARLVVAAPGVHREPAQLIRTLVDHCISTLHFVPSMLQAFIHESGVEACKSLKRIVCSGEALPLDAQVQVFAKLPKAGLYNLYGPTEAAIDVTHWTCIDEGADQVPIGRPIGNLRTLVLDAQLQPVPAGVAGELYLGGVGLARSYHRRPGLTAERFVPCPFHDGERLYRTGDRVRQRNDGVIEYLGRFDHQVKLRGLRIELGEIETRLMQHGLVREAVVLVPNGKQLVAWLVLNDPQTADDWQAGLKAWLLQALPEFMVPSLFVTLEKLPVTANGKLDRKALPLPEATARQAFSAPVSAMEKALAAIWSDLLGTEQVGLDDNFFELGGDSIISIQVVSRARQAGIGLNPRDLFQYQSVRSLAAVARTVTEQPASEQGAVTGTTPLLPIQQMFFDSEIPQRQQWNQSVLLKPAQALDAELLEQAVNALVAQHDALRLSFARQDGVWTASVRDNTTQALLWCSEISDLDQLAALGEEAQRSLDLQHGPLLRAVLVSLPSGEQRLLLVIHHLAVDGVSWRILFEDLQAAYQQLVQGHTVALPAKSSSIKAWAERLQGWANVPERAAEVAGWQQRLQGADVALPCANPHGAQLNRHALKVHSRLDKSLTSQLLHSAPTAYRTQVNDLLLTALARVVARWTGQDSVLLQLEGHGRETLFDELDLSRTVGWFTSLFPVRLSPAASLDASVKIIKEQLRAIPEKGIGFGALRYLGDADSRAALAALPQPRITFNYLGQFDASFAEDALFAPAREPAGRERSLDAPLGNWLSLDGQVYNGELSVAWTFSREVFAEAAMQVLADAFSAELTQLIEHCVNLPRACATPSDFALCGLDQAQLDALPVDAARIEDIYPLSPMQQGMLFHSLYEQSNGELVDKGYVNQLRIDVDGLDPERFRAAWQAAVDAHPVLRSAFLWQGKQPLQVVLKQAALEFSLHDWREHADLADALKTLAAADYRRGFDLAEAPLLRLQLVRTADNRHHLIYTSHHILMDGWSNSRLLGEVLQRYNGQHVAASAGRYRDYIGWLQRQDAVRDEAFWRGQLAELQEPIRLAQGEAQGETGYGEQVQRLDGARTQHLNQFARQQKVTLNTLVQAAWLLLLQRYTSQATVAFGATVAGRPAELVGVEEQVGLFINTLPVIASPRGELSVGDWLQTVQALNLSLREHEHTPLFDIQRWAGHGGEALFDNILVFENYPVSEVLQRGAPQGLRFGEIENVEQTHYPLTLTVNLGEVLDLQFSYARGHFSADGMARMAGHLENLLLAMAEDAERSLGELDLLGVVERRQLVEEWSTALTPPPASRTATERVPAHVLFEAQTARQPDAPALLFGDTVLSYAQLNARANQLARHLRTLGIGPDVLVGIAVERGLDMIIGLLAVLKAGGGYVPLDPEYPQDRLQCMIEDSGTKLLLTHSHLVERLAIPAGVAHLSLDHNAAWSGLSADNLPNQTDPQNLAYVMFTSGSTGRPKGVGISQLALTRHAYVSLQFFNMDGGDRILQFSTFNFDGFVEQLYPALICGASVVLRGTDIWDSETFYRELIDKQISVVDLTTAYWNLLARDFAAAGPRDYGRLKQVHAGGEAMPPEGLAAWNQAGLGHVRLLNTYGPTEATVTVTALDCTDYVTGAKPTPSTMPIGNVLAGRSIYLLDDSGSPAPIGVVGELVIGGELLARGYFNRPGLSAERFLPDPFSSTGGRLYRTGDLARYNTDGVIEYVGRIDHQVKIRGFRIELGEIEARLAEQEAVRDTLVVAQPATNGLQLVAYVVPSDTSKAGTDAEQQAELRESIKAQLRENLPGYMIPAYILFLDKMPLSPNGKIDRKALPKADASQLQHAYIAPQTELQQQIAAIWQDVLDLQQVGLNDHFFELGGHSLLATQAVARIKPLLSCELSLRDLFAAPTLNAFSALLTARIAEGAPRKAVPKLVAVGPRSEASLSLVQRRLWVVEQLSSASGAYGMPLAVRLKGELHVPQLVSALNEVVRRHEVLRTAYVSDDEGDPLALISAELTVDLPLEDLSGLEHTVQERRVSEAVEDNARQPISLLQAPLLRGRVLRLAADEHVLLYSMHHIISDGWSMSVLVNETMEIYARLQAGDAKPLPALPVQYADYAHWQLALQDAGILREQADYWREALAGHDGLLRLPTDFPRPPTPSQAGEDFSFALDPTLYQQLKALSRQAGVTLYSTLLGSFQLLLHRVTGSDDVLVGADVAGRSQPELEGLIGFFVNILPLRSRLDAGQSLPDYLGSVQQALINGFERQDLPFDMIVEAAGAPRHKGHNPLVQALFVMNNLPLQGASLNGLEVEVLHTNGGYSKFDMALFIDEEADRLLGTWQFATDLFKRERIAALVKDWTTMLGRITAQANITLGEIDVSTPQAVSQAAAALLAPAGKADKLGKFLKKAQGAARPAVALMRETPLVPGQVFPLLMEPTDPGLDLVEWVKANRPLIEEKLSHHAGILFRGFNLRDIHGFEAFAEAVQPGLYGQYGDLPKKEGGKNTYRSTPYPEKKMILFHNESSHQDRWPRKQMFYCEQPSPVGGATPVVDCRLMYQRLPVELQQRFESKGLLYVRTFADKLDVSWQHFFKTDVRADVEARCQLAGIQWTWLDNDELQIRTPCPAVIRHPLTGEKSFFNQVQLHHIHCLDPDVREDLLALFGETRMPRHVYYGDGSPIEDEVMQLIGDLYEACAVRFDWQKGDVILLDNMLAAHARDPYEGPRKIVVAMGEMIERSQLDAPYAALHSTTDKETAGA
ncbi:amino acid adenylation domain-containing protein [Pseudomonas sp. NPDC090202]|uniref:amino acid adenylation domain-containing protein n=1 Tax=unclassified Pseudomonas TaxID=196821 RepID=UPI0038043EDA